MATRKAARETGETPACEGEEGMLHFTVYSGETLHTDMKDAPDFLGESLHRGLLEVGREGPGSAEHLHFSLGSILLRLGPSSGLV